ncbi:ATP-binding cassette, subfamily C, CydC [Agromyces sp. CF514]|uniref:thiol reductant ABC exporter subunit CydC n=1 Tax=Agromyces sp. CF514 TaxID=1881031 RepID=UPI0008E414CB|nr:thiol reductant ABC exporter subunit CydC [Agromyces sp. CF514]SFR78898.1 ATP-binding cassette, subfamily C, CydC [Agromyces sp. CF514]
MSERGIATLRAAVPSAGRLAPSVLAGMASGLSAIALLACSAWLIARAAEQPPVLYLSVAVVGVRAFALGRAVFRYLERLTGHDASFRQLASIRTGVFERMLPLAPDGLVGTRRGDLLARFVDDVDELQNVPLRVVQPLVSAAIVLVAAIVGVALLAPASALAVLACLVAGIGLTLLAQRAAAVRAQRELAPLRGDLQAAVLEHVQSVDVLVAFDAADASRARIEQLGERLARATRSRVMAAGAASASMTAIGGFAVAASLAAAAPLLEAGRIDGPTFAVLALVPLAIAEVAAAIPLAATAWRQARASAARVESAVPQQVPACIPVAPTHPVSPAGGRVPPSIRLRDVRASWPAAVDGRDEAVPGVESERRTTATSGTALEHVDLDLEPGECALLRGPSGAGKTTLAHVLVRFLDYDGSYRIGDVEASRLDPDALRSLVGLVEQRPWLFDESVRQNLLFARDDASDADLLDALDRVGLREWVAERGGLDAMVGERGSLVSGGQAQRIALARATLAGFPVLVLDEPTANVDAAQADALMHDLVSAARGAGRTVLVISHAPVDERLIDRTFTMAEGRADGRSTT